MIDGNKIKITRKRLHLSQQKLAAGITTQGTISSLERNSTSPGSTILVKLLNRLNLTLADVVSENDPVRVDTLLKKADKLSMNYQYAKVIEVLKKIKNLTEPEQKKHYQFLYTDAKMWLEKKYDDAIFGFNQMLQLPQNDLDIYTVLATCELGVAYDMKKEPAKASFYFEKTADLFKKISVEAYIFWNLLISDNLAMYYSNTNQNDKCLEIIDQALEAAKISATSYFVDSFYYLYGEIKMQDGEKQDAFRYMIYARSFANFSDNRLIAEKAEKFLTSHGININI